MENKELKEFKAKVRSAIADYMRSEGCSCCRNVHDHELNTKRLAKLLNVKMYEDKSGYNFSPYQTKK